MRYGLGKYRSIRLAAGLCLLTVGSALGAGDWRQDWATVENDRHGFLIAYPVEVFQPKTAPTTDEGRVLYSPDGKAQLLVGAFANDEQMTLQAYREFLLQESYSGAAIDYSPVHGTWFVLSGTLGDREFYERVSFTCGGRLINSWAMVYPVSPADQNRFYDRVVEAIARTYTPGAGRSGNCD
jgi:hypothetical protein